MARAGFNAASHTGHACHMSVVGRQPCPALITSNRELFQDFHWSEYGWKFKFEFSFVHIVSFDHCYSFTTLKVCSLLLVAQG